MGNTEGLVDKALVDPLSIRSKHTLSHVLTAILSA